MPAQEDSPAFDVLIMQALQEDLGPEDIDITTQYTINPSHISKAHIVTRQNGIVSGLDVARRVFEIVDPSLELETNKNNGVGLSAGDILLRVKGSTQSILKAERTALNFLTHLCGVATQTHAYVESTKHISAAICCTRKTLPGLRALQKIAVSHGGGLNHRQGLYDAILIKDNHITAAGGVKEALKLASNNKKEHETIEIEVDTLDQLQDVIEHGHANIVLLDNFSIEDLKQAVTLCKGRITTEASGGIDLHTVKAVAETGVDRISVGALTHSVISVDLGLDFES